MSKRIVGFAVAVLVLAGHIATRAGDADPAKEIVAKAIKAAGGQAKLATLKMGTCKARATVQDGGQMINATFDASWQGAESYRMTASLDVMGKAKNAIIVLSGGKGWAKDLDRGRVEEAPKDVAPLIINMLYALRMPHVLPTLLDKDTKLSPLGEIKVGDRAALGVTVSHKDRKDVSLFFDKETGLPVRSEVRLTDERGQEKTFEFLYHDYKEAAGVKHPTRINAKFDKADVVLEVTELKALDKVDPGTFAKPE